MSGYMEQVEPPVPVKQYTSLRVRFWLIVKVRFTVRLRVIVKVRVRVEVRLCAEVEQCKGDGASPV